MSSLPTPSAPAMPRPPEERRERRRAVEAALLARKTTREVLDLGLSWGVSERTIRADVRRVERAWAREDGRHLAGRRAALLRTLDALGERAEREGDLAVAVRAREVLGRFLGLGATAAPGAPGSPTVNVDARSVHLGGEALRLALGEYLKDPEFVRAATERLALPAHVPLHGKD